MVRYLRRQGFGTCTHLGPAGCARKLYWAMLTLMIMFPLNLLPLGHAQADAHSHIAANLFARVFVF